MNQRYFCPLSHCNIINGLMKSIIFASFIHSLNQLMMSIRRKKCASKTRIQMSQLFNWSHCLHLPAGGSFSPSVIHSPYILYFISIGIAWEGSSALFISTAIAEWLMVMSKSLPRQTIGEWLSYSFRRGIGTTFKKIGCFLFWELLVHPDL